ncbi:MAG: DUF2185 domain-containing protein [Phycisphaerales bacterium JB059]
MLWKRKREIGYVLASKRVGVDRMPVRFMYRESPDNDQDSGWRVFAGDETQEFTDNPDNFAIYNPETICEIDPDVEKILYHKPVGFAYERADATEPFVESEWEAPDEED